jgi:RNA polymerase sigma-70 factor (ECF subfamily)
LLQVNEASGRIADLLQRVAARDRQAFAELYSATSAKLYGIVLRILKRRDLTDEIVQEVYVKIWQAAADYDTGKGSPITWMAAIARNRAIDEARRVTPVSLDDAPEVMELASKEPDGFAVLQAKQDMQKLLNCMEALEPERRDIVRLAYMNGLSREALSAQFGRPVATIKTWLHRSLAQLKDCVGQ